MTFTTPTFIVFFALVCTLYWRIGLRWQNRLILAASLVFYGWWDWRYLSLVLFTAGVDYGVARALGRTDAVRARRSLLLVSLASNLGVLGLFKYFDFFAASFVAAATRLGFDPDPVVLHLVLPVGISFYTFQALSYTIDVYRREVAPVREPIQYFAYITFFPQLVAGPIERATHLLPQFARERQLDPTAVADGGRQMLWGFFKKMVVADSLAAFVNASYAGAAEASGGRLLWATYAFAFQIYCDFSGYTDIATGCARFFGFRLMRNFDYPYFSRSIPEFWRRWHISLSTWFRDYVFYPLGGSHVGPVRWMLNVMLVFGVSGLWHGANWTFVVWGLLHGLFYLGSRARWRGRPGPLRLPWWRQAFAAALTFHLVCLAWVFFRASSMDQALLILTRIGSSIASGALEGPPAGSGLAWVLVLLVAEFLQRRQPHALAIGRWGLHARWAAYYAVVATLLLFADLHYVPFIYFQF